DFLGTLEVVRAARFAGAFTFQYSIRPGTPAAELPDQVPADVVRDRYGRLAALVSEVSWAENQKLAGRQVQVLVADGEGRKDTATHRMSGRAADNRLVHFAPGDGDAAGPPRPGDLIITTVTRGAPTYLLADEPPLSIRRTRGGDAWAARADAASAGVPEQPPGVLLGMPGARPLPD
ncbi:MAG TPA: tRNA (N6-isopentenyl adenosine(37)-C2)-methylthiotransferase MiaB, partial [Streptosporangiaceae bacterium]